MGWARHVVCMWCKTGAYRVLAQKPEGKRPLEGRRRRWKKYIEINLKEIVWKGEDLNDLAQDRGKWWAFVNAVMNIRFSYNVGNCLSGRGTVSISRTALNHGVSE
jgi:hypothetical protein